MWIIALLSKGIRNKPMGEFRITLSTQIYRKNLSKSKVVPKGNRRNS